jgi:hypothetical protein
VVVSFAQQAALDAFFDDYNARWRARTTCAPGYARYCENL